MNQLLAVKIDNIPMGTGKNLSETYPTVSVLFSVILKNALTIIGILFLVFLIYGGLSYIMNAGNADPKKAQQAQGILINALIGFAVVFLSYFIIQIVQVLTGVNILNPSL